MKQRRPWDEALRLPSGLRKGAVTLPEVGTDVSRLDAGGQAFRSFAAQEHRCE